MIRRLVYTTLLLLISSSAVYAQGFAVAVVGFEAEKRDLKDQISLVGTMKANEFVDIKSEIDGSVEVINFKEGHKVKQGDLLFQIDKKKLQASLDQAQAEVKLAESTSKRYAALVESKAVSRQEYDETTAKLEAGRAALELAKEQLNDATITAPFDGMMGQREVSLGQYVSKGTMMGYVVSQDPMKAEFHVPERYLGEISIGLKVSIKVAAYKDQDFAGEVYFIDPRINEQTRTALVKAYVPNPDGKLRSGMFANLDLIINITSGAVVIPETALIVKGDSLSVYVVGEEKKVELREVNAGVRMDGMVHIKSGVNVGEVVVTEGYQKIGPGAEVNVTIEDPSVKKPYEII